MGAIERKEQIDERNPGFATKTDSRAMLGSVGIDKRWAQMTIADTGCASTVGSGYSDYQGNGPKSVITWHYFPQGDRNSLYPEPKFEGQNSHNIRYLLQGDSHNIR